MVSVLREGLATSVRDGRCFAVLAALGFSLKAVFVKLAYSAGPVDALTLLAMRMGFALPLFLWLLHKTGNQVRGPVSGPDIWRIWLLAALGYYLSSLFDFKGLSYISAGLERLILYIYPTLVLLMQAWTSRRRPQAATWRALAICYAGLLVAFAHDLGQARKGDDVLIGAAWVFASAVTYALYYFRTGVLVDRVGSTRLAGLAGSASCILVLAHFLLAGQPRLLFKLPTAVWGHAAMMALVSTVLPIWWLSIAIQRLGAGQAATVGTLGPVLTIFAAWLILGEPLSLLQLVGMALVMVGVMRLKPAAAEKAADTG